MYLVTLYHAWFTLGELFGQFGYRKIRIQDPLFFCYQPKVALIHTAWVYKLRDPKNSAKLIRQAEP